ncbi:lysine biosynthesis protein LysW [Amycolatopsis sp. NPDC047767]|uniref:lysine biosynthesis protein LysW n=1 Tax=Amycolatopsis sp. NPDC047767 TaxID=3156765 RepID=UPI003453DA45
MTLQECPECAGKVSVPEVPELSEIVECAECAGEFEVVSVSPVMLALAPEPDEDWGE